MSLGGSFQLLQTLRKSPAVLRRRFNRDNTKILSQGDPLFKVHYLGTEKIYSLDLEHAKSTIGKLLQQASEKLSKDHALVVRPRYVEVKEISTGRQLTKTYLRDIAYCTADTENPNVFLYICRQQGQQLQCRVFWCSSAEQAKDITACLARSFQSALNDCQGSEADHTQGSTRNGLSMIPNLHSKLPEDLRKGRWRKRRLVSRSPLKVVRRTSRQPNDV